MTKGVYFVLLTVVQAWLVLGPDELVLRLQHLRAIISPCRWATLQAWESLEQTPSNAWSLSGFNWGLHPDWVIFAERCLEECLSGISNCHAQAKLLSHNQKCS